MQNLLRQAWRFYILGKSIKDTDCFTFVYYASTLKGPSSDFSEWSFLFIYDAISPKESLFFNFSCIDQTICTQEERDNVYCNCLYLTEKLNGYHN